MQSYTLVNHILSLIFTSYRLLSCAFFMMTSYNLYIIIKLHHEKYYNNLYVAIPLVIVLEVQKLKEPQGNI